MLSSQGMLNMTSSVEKCEKISLLKDVKGVQDFKSFEK